MGIEHKSVSTGFEITENGNCEGTEAEKGDKNGEQNESDETGKVGKLLQWRNWSLRESSPF